MDTHEGAAVAVARVRRPRMPKQVRLGAHTYAIILQDEVKDRATGELLNGDIDHNELVIRIHRKLRRSKRQEILLHEINHGCLYAVLEPKEATTEEEFVDATAPRLLEMLQENPEVVSYLTVKSKS